MTWNADTDIETGGRDDRLLPWRRVRDIAGISRTTAWRLQQTGDFPAPVPVSAGRVGWWESELNAWKATRLRPAGRPKPLRPPRAPKLIETARSKRPLPSGRSEETGASPVQGRLPLEAAPVRARTRRAKPSAATNQIDFGF